MSARAKMPQLPSGQDLSLPRHAAECLRSAPTFVDLFCGCGGLSLGFVQAGFRPLLGVDVDSAALATYRANIYAETWHGYIEDFVERLEVGEVRLERVDVVIGGPPCQGFSPLGRMSVSPARREKHKSMNQLWRYFMKVVERLSPCVFVTENVPEFRRSGEFAAYLKAGEALGYRMVHAVLSADLYGVPQRRRRLFCIGTRSGQPLLPPPTGERTTVRDAIGHLSPVPTGENWHVGRNPTPLSIERYKCIPPGGNRFDLVAVRPDIAPQCWLRKKTGSTDVFGRLEWDGVAATIRTEFYKPEKGRYLHPEQHRPITHREAACLQSFPDSFVFVGSKVEVARQIGEAVPPKLAYEVARAVLWVLSSYSEEQCLGG